MRERSIEEFESLFEQAAIPVLDINEIVLARISAVLTGDRLDESVLKLAAYLRSRFTAEVTVHLGETIESADKETEDLATAIQPFASTAELVGQVEIRRSQLVLLPGPEEELACMVDIDAMVQGASPPVLLIRQPVQQPSGMFGKILHSLTGDFQQSRNFAHSFTLVEDSGLIMLLHTIDRQDIADVRNALKATPSIDTLESQDLLDALAGHGERYLKGVVAASRSSTYDVCYRLTVGQVVPSVQNELSRGGYGLLVVGRHSGGYSVVGADDYQLMHTIRDIPVLAL